MTVFYGFRWIMWGHMWALHRCPYDSFWSSHPHMSILHNIKCIHFLSYIKIEKNATTSKARVQHNQSNSNCTWVGNLQLRMVSMMYVRLSFMSCFTWVLSLPKNNLGQVLVEPIYELTHPNFHPSMLTVTRTKNIRVGM